MMVVSVIIFEREEEEEEREGGREFLKRFQISSNQINLNRMDPSQLFKRWFPRENKTVGQVFYLINYHPSDYLFYYSTLYSLLQNGTYFRSFQSDVDTDC